MSCCKNKTTKLIKETPKLTVKYISKKIASIILVGILLLILTPLMVIMIWYLGMKMIIGTDSDYIGMINEKYGFFKNKEEPIEEEEINPDDYELLGVEVIK